MVPTVLGGIGGGADATSILTSSTSRPITVTFRAMVIRAMPGLWDPWFLVLRVPSVVPHKVFRIYFSGHPCGPVQEPALPQIAP